MATRAEGSVEQADRVERLGRITAVVIGMAFLLPGLWAFLSPSTFYDTLATFEPYNAHFIRDIGAFQIGLGAVLLFAVVVKDALLAALAGVSFGAAFHLVAHILDHDRGGQPVLDIPTFGLIAVVLVAAAVSRAMTLRR